MTAGAQSPGAVVAAVRKDFGLTQAGLAALLGVHPITVSKWETGRSAVPAWHQALLRLAWTATTPAQQVRVREILVSRGPAVALAWCLRRVDFPEVS